MTKEERRALLSIVDRAEDMRVTLYLRCLDYKMLNLLQSGEVVADEEAQAKLFDEAWSRLEAFLGEFEELQEDLNALRDNTLVSEV